MYIILYCGVVVYLVLSVCLAAIHQFSTKYLCMYPPITNHGIVLFIPVMQNLLICDFLKRNMFGYLYFLEVLL